MSIESDTFPYTRDFPFYRWIGICVFSLILMLVITGVLLSLAGSERLLIIAISLSIVLNTLVFGTFQINTLNDFLPVPRLWVLATLGASLWFTGIYLAIWSSFMGWSVGFMMGVTLWVSGGLIGGFPQFFILSKTVQRFGWWILISFIALLMAGVTIYISINLLLSLQWFALFLALVLGGLVYGSITGLYLKNISPIRSGISMDKESVHWQ